MRYEMVRRRQVKENNARSYWRFVGEGKRVVFAVQAPFCAGVVEILRIPEQRPQVIVVITGGRQRFSHRNVVLPGPASTSKTLSKYAKATETIQILRYTQGRAIKSVGCCTKPSMCVMLY